MMRARVPSHRCASAQRGSDPDFPWLAEEPLEERFRGAVDPRALALARPGDVQHAHAVPSSPGAEALPADAPPELDDEQRLAVAPARQLGGEQRPAVEPAAVDDQRAVRIAHVPLRALDVIAGRRLDQAVAPRDAPILRPPALRAPAPARDAQLPRRVERRAVDARLPAGDDLPQQRRTLARQLAALDELREIARPADQHAFDEHHRERRPPGPHLQREAPAPLAEVAAVLEILVREPGVS